MSPSCSALLPFQTIYLSSCRTLTAAGSQVESAARGSLPPSRYLQDKSEPANKYHGHWVTEKCKEICRTLVGGRREGLTRRSELAHFDVGGEQVRQDEELSLPPK